MDKRSLKNDLHTSNFVILNNLFKSPFYVLKSTLNYVTLLKLSINLHINLAPRDNLQMYYNEIPFMTGLFSPDSSLGKTCCL